MTDQPAVPSLPASIEPVADALAKADITVVGQLSGASNATLLCTLDAAETGRQIRCVYKPRRGERPLWDFPTGTLGRREVATFAISRLLGWDVVPVTVWRKDGPYGPGMCQLWIDDDDSRPAVDVVSPGEVPASWKVAVHAQTYDGSDVVLIHEDTPELRQLAVLDLITNNADRKGGHILRNAVGAVMGIDHGLTFHVEAKLRTVLWGWADQQIDPELLQDVAGLAERLCGPRTDLETLTMHLSESEIAAVTERTIELAGIGRFPRPEPGYPALPWPPL